MPAAHVQTQTVNVQSATSVSVTLTLTAANAVIVTLVADTSKAGLGSPGQTAGDTLTFCFEDLVNPYQAQYINHAVAGGSTTFTFGWSNPQNANLFVTEVSGLKASSAFDQSSALGSSTATTHSTGTTGTLTQADEFALATFNADGSGPMVFVSLTNGFSVPTNGNQIDGVGVTPKALVAYKVLSSTAGVETTLTTSDNMVGEGMVGTYMAAAGGGPAIPLWAQSVM